MLITTDKINCGIIRKALISLGWVIGEPLSLERSGYLICSLLHLFVQTVLLTMMIWKNLETLKIRITCLIWLALPVTGDPRGIGRVK